MPRMFGVAFSILLGLAFTAAGRMANTPDQSDIEYIVDPQWASGNDLVNMRYDNAKGDGRTLNLYFIDEFQGEAAKCSVPDALETDRFSHKIDGLVIASSAMFKKSFKPQNKTIVPKLGSWFRLREVFSRGGCDG